MRKKSLLVLSAVLTVSPTALALSLTEAPHVHLTGTVARKMSALIDERVTGADARGCHYDEAVNAFRTHYDDTEDAPDRPDWGKGKGLWQGEYWGKSMLAAIAVAEYLGDAALKENLRARARAFVKEYQQPDGYLCTYRRRDFLGGPSPDGKEVFAWNLWGRKYTIWALLEIARVANAPDLLAAAARVTDQEIAQLDALKIPIERTGYFVGLPSMSVLKPLLLLYERTDNPAYLAFADRIVAAWERPGNPAPNLIANAFGDRPVHAWYPDPGHWAKAYEMMSCLEGLVEYARVKRDARILDAVVRIVRKLERDELNAVGSVGFFDHFSHAAACPNATTEPCDVVHWIRLNRELFLATDDPHALDLIEFAFCNAFLAGVYRDGKWGAHSVRSHGTRHRTAPHQVGMKYHQCCIDNMPRTFVDFADTAVTRTPNGGISVNSYLPLAATFGGDRLEIAGNYPISNVATVRVETVAGMRLRLRIPAWADAVAVDGVRVTGSWRTLDVPPGESAVVLAFARTPKVLDSSVRADADPRAYEFERSGEHPEMKGLARTAPAARVVYGPLLLAKAKSVTSDPATVLEKASVNGRSFRASLRPVRADGVWGAWELTLTDGTEKLVRRVCDFASAADFDDPTNLFSIWF